MAQGKTKSEDQREVFIGMGRRMERQQKTNFG